MKDIFEKKKWEFECRRAAWGSMTAERIQLENFLINAKAKWKFHKLIDILKHSEIH